nr:hypothetical protein KK1_012206 [Ipomoea batatas]GMD25851.1 hypothetical protein KK1_012206 [Ipomoea batatas]GMD28774.1 hypothetical protein KK1_012206 [Ipomoea batatas]
MLGLCASLVVQIIGLPKMIQRTGFLLIKPHPWLPFPTPMKQAYWAWMQGPTRAQFVVPTQPMLVPAVINGLDKPTKNKQKWRQRSQLVNPSLPLKLHPFLQFPAEISGAPSPEIHHHDAGVEVARRSRVEYSRENRVGPEGIGEVFGEIGVTILRRSDDFRIGERNVPELENVVDEDHVGVETLKFSDGKTDRTWRVRARGVTASNSAAMKWRNTCSGQDAWRRTECTAAIEPRRYSESSVMAMWTRNGSQDDAVSLSLSSSCFFAGQSAPFRYSGASKNPNPVLSGKLRIPMQSNGTNDATIKIKKTALIE